MSSPIHGSASVSTSSEGTSDANQREEEHSESGGSSEDGEEEEGYSDNEYEEVEYETDSGSGAGRQTGQGSGRMNWPSDDEGSEDEQADKHIHWSFRKLHRGGDLCAWMPATWSLLVKDRHPVLQEKHSEAVTEDTTGQNCQGDPSTADKTASTGRSLVMGPALGIDVLSNLLFTVESASEHLHRLEELLFKANMSTSTESASPLFIKSYFKAQDLNTDHQNLAQQTLGNLKTIIGLLKPENDFAAASRQMTIYNGKTAAINHVNGFSAWAASEGGSSRAPVVQTSKFMAAMAGEGRDYLQERHFDDHARGRDPTRHHAVEFLTSLLETLAELESSIQSEAEWREWQAQQRESSGQTGSEYGGNGYVQSYSNEYHATVSQALIDITKQIQSVNDELERKQDEADRSLILTLEDK